MDALKVGDILHAQWGYSMILNTFAEVVEVSASGKSVKVRELKNEVVKSDGFLSGREVPKAGEYKDEKVRVLRVSDRMKWFKGSYGYLRKWDGLPCSFDHCD